MATLQSLVVSASRVVSQRTPDVKFGGGGKEIDLAQKVVKKYPFWFGLWLQNTFRYTEANVLNNDKTFPPSSRHYGEDFALF